MKKYVNAEASMHEMKLLQMGAKVEQINSKMCYVRFAIDGIKVEYVYNLNSKNKYFLERIKPYKLPVKEFETESDIVKVIEVDIKQFIKASKSKNIHTFIDIANELNVILKRFEDLYLYYNVPQNEASKILERIKTLHNDISEVQDTSERVFFEKDPENL